MQNQWNEEQAALAQSDLELRAYSSRLIGNDRSLVLHGGGNTSVKSDYTDRFGETKDIIWVKASGFDLATMGPEGFTALELEPLIRLSTLEKLSDADMVNDVLCARLDASAAAASIEAIVHAIIPFKFVDHSHADAILTISNAPDGGNLFKKIYGDRVLVLPYVKPGFDLALQFKAALRDHDLSAYEAIILEHHGIFTCSDDAKTSYDLMISIVDEAEQYLKSNHGSPDPIALDNQDLIEVAKSRNAVSELAGSPVISIAAHSIAAEKATKYAQLLRGGTLTPEHVIHNKPFPAKIGKEIGDDLSAFEKEYRDYFTRAGDPDLVMLTPNPHWAIYETGHCRSFGVNLKRASISSDVANSTLKAMHYADQMGGWQGLSEEDLRGLEYWELEQAKLKRQKPPSRLTGKIAVVSGAAAGIGLACVRHLLEQGAVVAGLDINPEIEEVINNPAYLGINVDLTDEQATRQALEQVVDGFGGLDIIVSNAGIFRTGKKIEDLGDDNWDQTLEVNLTSHRKLIKCAIPYLRHGIDPSVVFVASRNVAAPGAGAAAYSVSKAGLTQLMRVLALELASEGINVNAVHPDAVFDTRLWTQEALETSAARYGLSVEEYKTRNLLKTEITSRDVAQAVGALVDGTLSKSTGAQLPVDGGNDRVI